MDEVGEAVLDFNKKCGKAEKAILDFDGRLKKRLTKTQETVDEKFNQIMREMASTSLNDREKVRSLGRAMAGVNDKILSSMENILKIEYKLTKVFADMCKTARQTKKSTFKRFKDMSVFFKEELFATQKRAIAELVAEVDRTAGPWKTRTDATEDLMDEMGKCRFTEADDFPTKIQKFESMIRLFRGYEPVKITRCRKTVISMGGNDGKSKEESNQLRTSH